MTQQIINAAKAKIPFMTLNPTACTWIDGLGWVNGLERVKKIATYEAN